jgi:hypothetical protein
MKITTSVLAPDEDKIAHPVHRERLEKEAFDRMKCMPSP